MPPHSVRALTPHERAGQTRRSRTRHQIEQALAELLEEQAYDDIRASHLIERAGIGAATFYQVAGDKAQATGSLVLSDLGMSIDTLQQQVELANDVPADLRNFLFDLGRYGFEYPRRAHAFCRAYYKSVAEVPLDRETIHPCSELVSAVQRWLNAAARRQQCRPYAAELALGALATTTALLAGQPPTSENWRHQVELLTMLLGIDAKDEV